MTKQEILNLSDSEKLQLISGAKISADIRVIFEYIVFNKSNIPNFDTFIYYMAVNKNTPQDIFIEILKLKDVKAIRQMAVNYAVEEKVLQLIFSYFIKNNDYDGLYLLSKNQNLPSEIGFKLISLYKKNSPEKLKSMLYNMLYTGKCKNDLLESLANEFLLKEDRFSYKILFLRNKNISEKLFNKILKRFESEISSQDKLNIFTQNENVPENFLEWVIKYCIQNHKYEIYNSILTNQRIDKKIKLKILTEGFINYINKNDSGNSINKLLLEIPEYSVRIELAKKVIQSKGLNKNSPENYKNITTPNIQRGNGLYEALLKRQELQYKYDILSDYYNNKSGGSRDWKFPSSEKFKNGVLPVIKFNLISVNKTIITFLFSVINNWRKERLNTRLTRIPEMEQNEVILEELESAKTSKNINQQRMAIEKALNTVHSHGEMIEHVGIERAALDYLSNMDTTKWDRELEHMASSKNKIVISSRDNND